MNTYRLSASLVWDIKSKAELEEIKELAESQLNELIQGSTFRRSPINVAKLRSKKAELIRLATYKPEEILSLITQKETRKDFKVDGKVYSVRMNSHRYFTFARSLICISCGLVGCKMVLERDSAHEFPHFNLYAEENDELILMTKDHIHPLASGGENRLENYQTMCSVCNGIKGDANISPDDLKHLRQLYNENKEKLSPKKFFELIESAKAFVTKPCPKASAEDSKKQAEKKSRRKSVITICKLMIWEAPFKHEHDGCVFFAKADWESISDGWKVVGEIECGKELKPKGRDGKRVIVNHEGKDVFIYQANLS